VLNREAYSSYLESFGLNTDDVPTLGPPNDLAQVLKFIKGNKHRIDKQYASQIDDYVKALQDNTTNLLMQKLSGDLVTRLRQLGFPKQLKTFTGVFPTNSFNAQAVRQADGALILIDVGCFGLIEALTMLWAWEGERDRSVSQACRIIVDYVLKYSLPSPHDYDHPTLHDGMRLIAFTTLITKAEELVLAHEHAHVALGHLWSADCKAFSTPVGEAKFITKSHQQEMDADKLAMHAMFPVDKKVDDFTVRQIGAAPYIMFGTAYLLERAKQVINRKRFENCDTHPPAVVRLAIVEKQMEKWGFSALLDLGQKFFGWIHECADFLKDMNADSSAIQKAIHQIRYPPVKLPAHISVPRVGVYVRTSVLTTKYDSHEKELLEYCAAHSWNTCKVYRDKKGGNIDKDKMDWLLEMERSGKFKEGGFDLFFALLNAASYAKSGRKDMASAVEGGLFDARNQMVRDARDRKLDLVIAYDLGRFGSNKLAVFQCVETLRKVGITVIVPDIGILGDNTIYPAGLDYE